MSKSVIIVAGGVGNRMNNKLPKQFIEINKLPVIIHTINKFIQYNSDIEIVLVINPEFLETWKVLTKKFNLLFKYKLALGGKTRFESVKNGLEKVTKGNIVAIHDSVRPCVSIETIESCFKTAEKLGNAIPVVNVSDSVRILSNEGSKHFDRSLLKLVQTPQTFQYSIITKAYLQKYSEKFTDDASVVENIGIKINLVEGNKENIKITEKEDLLIVETYLNHLKSN
ncbi:MAG: 2-C-methyl-D-erythritol 4-phosphate cytidylyltransferase [Bacteroidetes bacterium GWA2_30_7]|nr:MAG: 2-C-methyl-D-erythritol 4-phosphate cytidylyltransferase [Bacteroidetes bacterium GWA2_30_7]